MIAIEGGTFSGVDQHEYRDDKGKWVPSLTQVLKLQGLSDYSNVPEQVLKEASERGSAIHELVESHNRYGDIDPGWLTPETAPAFDGYLKMVKEIGFKADPAWSEKALVTCIYGMKIGMKLDARGTIDGQDCILEVKCTAAAQASWAYQTAGQEMGVLRTNRCGAVNRIACWLRKDGSYRLIPYRNHSYDAQQISAALTTVYARLDAGQKLWEKF